MVKLLILADDFTGALDTGVQFAALGIATKVIVDNGREKAEKAAKKLGDGSEKPDAQVLVIDAETRHLTPEEAYRRVYRIVANAVQEGIPYLYKKTDSALRGNIGSELQAVRDASGASQIPFIPAFPRMNRITRGGIHYIDGVPVSKSVFGQDPFEPVMLDSVKDIIHAQSQIAVTEIPVIGEPSDHAADGILAFDVTTEEELEQRASFLMEQGLCAVTAGCAGFAAKLPGMLGLVGSRRRREALKHRLVVICGSVNPITRRQLDHGETCGYPRIRLQAAEKLEKGFWDTDQGQRKLEELKEFCKNAACCIIDSNDVEGSKETQGYAWAHHITLEQMRVRISETMGRVGRKLLEQRLEAVFMITGGDTLLGFMKELGVCELVPVCELSAGSVLTRLCYEGTDYHVITKSGGFGEEGLLEQLVTILNNQKKELE